MRKLTKLKVAELSKEMPILTIEEEKGVIGGWDPVTGYQTLQIYGGSLIEQSNGTWFYGDDGRRIFFEGIGISTSYVLDRGAYQAGGTIHVGEYWANNGFGVDKFAHEYGHYLQEQEMGGAAYWSQVAVPSAYSAWSDLSNHDNQPYEQDATNRGQSYMNNNTSYPSSGGGYGV